ncbi:hypothetical protein ACTXT7_014561, partial [Hymenolepis weldensis]
AYVCVLKDHGAFGSSSGGCAVWTLKWPFIKRWRQVQEKLPVLLHRQQRSIWHYKPTSSLLDFAASSNQSTNLVKPHTSRTFRATTFAFNKLTLMYFLHRSMPNLKVTFIPRETTGLNDGLCVFLVAVLCCVFLRFVLAFTPMG